MTTCLIHLLLTTQDINLANGNGKPGPKPNLVPRIQHQENGKCNVRREEITNRPFRGEKDLEAIGEGKQANDAKREVAKVGLERGPEWEGVEEVAEDEGLAEADVGDHYDDPGDEAGDGGDVAEPGEDLSARVGHIEEGEKTDEPRGEDCNPRDAPAIRPAEDLRRISVQRHTV